jgi:hypothetical protein
VKRVKEESKRDIPSKTLPYLATSEYYKHVLRTRFNLFDFQDFAVPMIAASIHHSRICHILGLPISQSPLS